MRLGPVQMVHRPGSVAGNQTIEFWKPAPFAMIVHAVSATVSTDATVATRNLNIKLIRGTLQYEQMAAGTGMVASTIYLHVFHRRVNAQLVAGMISTPIPADWLIPPNTSLQMHILAGGQAGDSFGDIQMMYQEVLDW